MKDQSRSLSALKLAEITGSRLVGPDVWIHGVSGADSAGEGEVTMAVNSRALRQVLEGPAAAVVLPESLEASVKGQRTALISPNPRLAFASVLAHFAPPSDVPDGVSDKAVIAESVTMGEGVSIGPFAVVNGDVDIGRGTVVYPGVYIGSGVSIGEDCILYPNVSILSRCVIGNRVTIHASSVIGADGFGYVTDSDRHHKVPHIGIVVVEDDVEIGANSCVDRATVGETRVGCDSKLDNLVQVAHNASLGRGVIIAGLSGVGGSTILGDRVILAAMTGASDHCDIREGAVVLGQAAVQGRVKEGLQVSGVPARDHRLEMRSKLALRNLPETVEEVKDLRARLAEVEKLLKNLQRS